MSTLDKINSVANLKAMQRAFAEIIRRPLQSGDAMKADKRSDQMIIPNATLSPHERLELYAQQYWWRIRDSFYEDFTGVKKVLGDSLFDEVAEKYLITYPSRSYTLRNLGDRFPNFLRRSTLVPSRIKLLAFEVALLEWNKIEVFDAASGKHLGAQPAGDLKIALSPALRLNRLRYPAHSVFSRSSDGRDREQTSNVGRSNRSKSKQRNDGTFKISPRLTFLATHRYQRKIYFKVLTKDEFSLLSLIGEYKSVERALRRWKPSRDVKKNIEASVSAMFQEWGSLGWLCVQS